MTYTGAIAAGKRDVVLPSGIRLQAGQVVTLSDDEYAQLSPTALANFTGGALARTASTAGSVAFTVTLKAGLKDVVLPNGLRYQGSAVAVLSDSEYAQMQPSTVAALFSSVTHS